MQMRFSEIRGTFILDDATQETVGLIDRPLIDPDIGVIVGFFVKTSFSFASLFLQTQDIVSWGTSVHIRSVDRIGEIEDFVRFHALSQNGRPFLFQSIVTDDDHRTLGVCADVQFSTRHFQIEWIFPRRWFFFFGTPLPASSILEVTHDVILVRSSRHASKQKARIPSFPQPVLTPLAPELAPD